LSILFIPATANCNIVTPNCNANYSPNSSKTEIVVKILWAGKD